MSSQRQTQLGRKQTQLPPLSPPNAKIWNQIRHSTLELTNLHESVTHQSLFRKITIAGPFGKVYRLNFSEYRMGGDGALVIKAYISFFNRTDAQKFHAYLNDQGLVIKSMRIYASWAPNHLPPVIDHTLIPKEVYHSRVVLVQGPEEMDSRKVEHVLRRNGLVVESLPLWAWIEGYEGGRREAVLCFPSFADAQACIAGFERLERDDVRAVYGRDPVETGVTVEFDTESVNRGGVGFLKVKYEDMEWHYDASQDGIKSSKSQ